jgi:general nucleoside transport system ATP-binding protein
VTGAPALALRGIVKRFGPVPALAGVDLTITPGEVHALLGENGAGKSTLMHIAYGMIRPDTGEILVQGIPHHITSPRRARALGIGMVHQHFTSIPSLSVAENVALAAGWSVAPGALAARVDELSRRVGLPLDPGAQVKDLSVSLKQRLEIVKALAADARVLLLDEPTAVLAPAEVEELLRMIRAYAERGNSAVLITHKLDEALAAADRVTVLRRGIVVRSGGAAAESRASLAAAMIGDEAAPVRAASDADAGNNDS